MKDPARRSWLWNAVAIGVPLAAALTGCASQRLEADQARATAVPPTKPARISHVVLFDLQDPADAPALLADSVASLAGIPSVASLACGAPLETGRPNVSSDYDVGLYVGFDTEADYAAYLSHPEHVALVARWRDRSLGFRIFDFVDERLD